MHDVTILPITPQNMDFVESLYRDRDVREQLFAPSMNPGDFQRWVYGTAIRFVLHSSGVPVGVGVLSREGNRAFWGYALSPDARGKGLASGCLAAIEAYAASLGISTLTTNVADDNVRSIRALQRAGHRQFEWVEKNIA